MKEARRGSVSQLNMRACLCDLITSVCRLCCMITPSVPVQRPCYLSPDDLRTLDCLESKLVFKVTICTALGNTRSTPSFYSGGCLMTANVVARGAALF